MGVPNTFANATTTIPLVELDQNFATNVTIGTSQVGLGNTITSLAGLSNITSNGVTVISGAGAGGLDGGMVISGNIGNSPQQGIAIARTDAQLELQNKGSGHAFISIYNTLPASEEASVALCTTLSNGGTSEIGSINARLVNFSNNVNTWRGAVGISPLSSNGAGGVFEGPGIYCYSNSSGRISANILYNGGGDVRDNPPPDGWFYNYQNEVIMGTLLVGGLTTQIAGDINDIQFNGAANNGLGINDAPGHATASYLTFRFGGVLIGSVSSANSSAVVYNTTSDERLKENWRDPEATEVRDKVMSLYVGEHSWIGREGRYINFKAQQGHTVHPQAFTPSKADGDGEAPWFRAVGEMEPLLLLSQQKLYEKIDALEAKIAELEKGKDA